VHRRLGPGMYVLAVGARYLRARPIAYLAAVFVATGVLALVVMESIMGGFAHELERRLRGVHGDATLHAPDAASVEAWTRRAEASPLVRAAAPRRRGLVLLAFKNAVEPAELVGIDPARERLATAWADALVTPHDEVTQQLARLDHSRALSIRWELVGATATAPPAELVVRQIEHDAGWPAPRAELVGLEVDAELRVRRMRHSIRPDQLPSDLVGGDDPRLAAFRRWVDELGELARARRTEELVARWRTDLDFELVPRHKIYPLDPRAPFDLAGRPGLSPLPGLIVGYELYARLRLRAGETVVLYGARTDPATGELVTARRQFVVTGTTRSGLEVADAGVIHVAIDQASELLDPSRGNQVALALHDATDAEDACRALAAELGGEVALEPWDRAHRPILRAIALERRMMGVILALFLLCAGLAIAVILALFVLEKRHDIGVLATLGASPTGIAVLFVQAAVAIAVVGCAVGLAAGIPLAIHINEVERAVYQATGVALFPRDVYPLDRIPVSIDLANVARICALAVGLSVLASLIPARAAARLTPVELLGPR